MAVAFQMQHRRHGAQRSADRPFLATELPHKCAFPNPQFGNEKKNDIFPPGDLTEDWLQLIDQDPENVVKVSPYRARDKSQPPKSSAIV